MTPKKNILAGMLLLKNWEELMKKLTQTEIQIDSLQDSKAMYLDQLEGLLKTLDLIEARPPDLVIPNELKYKFASMGDIMETLIQKRGPMSKSDLITELHKTGKLTGKNTRIILANAIKRDAKKRFKVENGKVWLNENK